MEGAEPVSRKKQQREMEEKAGQKKKEEQAHDLGQLSQQSREKKKNTWPRPGGDNARHKHGQKKKKKSRPTH